MHVKNISIALNIFAAIWMAFGAVRLYFYYPQLTGHGTMPSGLLVIAGIFIGILLLATYSIYSNGKARKLALFLLGLLGVIKLLGLLKLLAAFDQVVIFNVITSVVLITIIWFSFFVLKRGHFEK